MSQISIAPGTPVVVVGFDMPFWPPGWASPVGTEQSVAGTVVQGNGKENSESR